ncbi:MAG TPA: hypothetical protein VEL51_14335 [Vicinamibacterales bacterium]|nr:hypothetical protein [Vicinamibacterales bacterium]
MSKLVRDWYHLEIASRDRRDTLVAAGFANADWPDVLKREGFPDLDE